MKCDCLNYCGDDPWLKDGRAKPCEEKKRRDAMMEKDRRQKQFIAHKPNYSAVCDEPGHILVKMPGMEYGIDNAEKARQLVQTLTQAIAEAWPDLS